MDKKSRNTIIVSIVALAIVLITVTYMDDMFSGSKATTLDLSSFDMSSVTSKGNMFYQSAATTGYARTQADADKLNATTNKPSGLTFVVKP